MNFASMARDLRAPLAATLRDMQSRPVEDSSVDAPRSVADSRVAPRAAIALVSAAAACVVFVAGAVVENRLISVLQPSQGELTWIGDLVLASTLGIVLYLWLHLRLTRAAFVELERARIVLDTQLAVAARIQRDLLPPPPRSRGGVSWAVRLVPAGRIGGDFYDFVDLDGRSRVAIVGDIAGKGIPAAMMLAYVRAVFRQAVRETHEPSQIASRLAHAMHEETRGETYLTCVVLRLDEDRRGLTTANAGHPPPVVVGAVSSVLSAGGPPAGMFPHATYDQESVQLSSGDRVIFVTDGVTERLPTVFDWLVKDLDRGVSAAELCASVFQLSASDDAAPPVPGWEDDRTVMVMAID